MGALSNHLRVCLADSDSPAWTSEQEQALEGALEAALAAGRAAWPGLTLDPMSFVANLAKHLASADPLLSIASLKHPELYLCAACLIGDARAATLFEERFMSAARKELASLGVSEDAQSEGLQRLRAHLLVGDGTRPPALAKYAGKGALEGWLRTAARRQVLNAQRGQWREIASPIATEGQDPQGQDAELRQLRARFRPELERAMSAALERLAPSQKALLHGYVVEGQGLDDLGKKHEVDPSTVSRWLRRIRDKLALEARRDFARRCGLPEAECESVIAAVHSEMHVSIARLLQESG